MSDKPELQGEDFRRHEFVKPWQPPLAQCAREHTSCSMLMSDLLPQPGCSVHEHTNIHLLKGRQRTCDSSGVAGIHGQRSRRRYSSGAHRAQLVEQTYLLVVLVAMQNPARIEQMMQSLANISREGGLEINASKTKLKSNSREIDVMVDANKIEYVKEYIYLGQIISPTDVMTKEINRRVAQGWRKYWSLKEIVKSKDLGGSRQSHKKKFETCILPVLTYGCETCSTTLHHRERLTKCQRAMERKKRLKIKDRVRNMSKNGGGLDICYATPLTNGASKSPSGNQETVKEVGVVKSADGKMT
ncbi:hypothetical protein MSG28_005893 [Choristoneura fumiferana]|uniref:Uncharacterized protein n=1 Tax=Choristoneura fumiferana TaxID=7141 RepID=A0ACC0L1X2_CHOFU|nr:hypothetical protein MSG28_005893 [Choristoneura fumiferana]